ncbi:MAG: ELM1/GtrOC1 family putative glycosyltransferase [Aestuariivirga sp.]|uniref:ELM1/GtrOC1 family putative glycosyltransferase n=1 Tax=Aestuariivirga sp. TaxID=2650926 RepID=UPI0038D1F197
MAADPRVWILSGGRQGDLDQMQALIAAAGWAHEIKRLSFRGPRHPLLARLETPLRPPWPDLAICAEALPSMVARRIKKSSSGATRIVCLGRPAGSASDFDLVITTAQYRIQNAPNLLELAMPITSAAVMPPPPPADGPVVVLVGGPAFPDRLDSGIAARLAADVLAYAARKKLTLHVVTSPRTPREAIAVFARKINAPHQLSVFGQSQNSYQDALASAAEIVVTSDSVSMLSDAMAAARPVSIYRLPQALGLKWRLGDWLHRHAVEQPQPLLKPASWLFDLAVIEPAADRQRLFTRLVSEKQLAWFDMPPAMPDGNAPRRDLEMAADRVRKLMAV